MAQGLKWVLDTCQLQAQVLTCTLNVENAGKSPVNLQIPGTSVMAVTSSGWLYLGQVSPNPIKLSPRQKTRATVRFNGVSQNTDFFAVIRLGEAWFTGVTIPSEKITASNARCRFVGGPFSDKILTCTLVVRNENPQDLTLTILGPNSFVTIDSGATFKGARGMGGEERISLIVPAKGEVGISLQFGVNDYSFRQDGYFPQKANIVRFRTIGGWIEARDVPFLYCGENYGSCQNP